MKHNKKPRRQRTSLPSRDRRFDGKFDTQIIDVELSQHLCALKVQKSERRMLALTSYIENMLIALETQWGGRLGKFKKGITELHKKLGMSYKWTKIDGYFYKSTIKFEDTINLIALRIDFKNQTIAGSTLIKCTHHALERFVQRNSPNYQLVPSVIFTLLEKSLLNYFHCKYLDECQTAEGGIRIPIDDYGLMTIVCQEDPENTIPGKSTLIIVTVYQNLETSKRCSSALEQALEHI